jgi:hypothetical protein
MPGVRRTVLRLGSASGAAFGMRGVSPSLMSLWEYKIISSGKGGFATPAMLEKFLNDLGRDEWEIIDFRSPPDNALAFTGLARRSTQRDWTLEDAAAAAAKVEAEKLRAEFAAKFQAGSSNAPAAEEKSASFLEEKSAPDDGFRKPVDTSRDSEPESAEDEAEKDEWDKLAKEDELPSFFDALKPHMRRNQRGPGMSVGTDYLAKKWELSEEDIKGALVECGMQIPADENAKPVYVEYDGDLFWVNINRRGEVWINTREKPRPVFRVVQGTKVAPDSVEEPKPENGPRQDERRERHDERRDRHEPHAGSADQPREPEVAAKPEAPIFQPKASARNQEPKPAQPGAPLPTGPALLEKIRPLMRRNRRGPGGSGSATFLARAFKCNEADLIAGFQALHLVLPATPTDQPIEVEIAGDIWWLNQDSRGGVWINGREKREGEVVGAPKPDSSAPVAPVEGVPQTAPLPLETVAQPEQSAAPTGSDGVFSAVRLLLKETKTGSFAGKVDRVAGDLSKSPDELTSSLLSLGLKVPEKPREKPVFVEHAGEIFWLNKNAKGELWVNAKASKYADKDEPAEGEASSGSTSDVEKKPARRGGGRSKKSAE